MAAWRANPPIKWRCRCHGAFPSNIHPPIAQRGLRSSSSILFPFSRSMEPRLSVDIITHRHIGPATILTSFLDRSSWTSGSFQLVALHGASCRNNRPAYMSQLSEDDSTLPSYIPPALRDSACTNWCEVHNENMWQGPSFPSPSGSCSRSEVTFLWSTTAGCIFTVALALPLRCKTTISESLRYGAHLFRAPKYVVILWVLGCTYTILHKGSTRGRKKHEVQLQEHCSQFPFSQPKA